MEAAIHALIDELIDLIERPRQLAVVTVERLRIATGAGTVAVMTLHASAHPMVRATAPSERAALMRPAMRELSSFPNTPPTHVDPQSGRSLLERALAQQGFGAGLCVPLRHFGRLVGFILLLDLPAPIDAPAPSLERLARFLGVAMHPRLDPIHLPQTPPLAPPPHRPSPQHMRQQRMEALGTLAGGIAHDFNNIIAAVNGYAELILDDMDPSDKNRPDLIEIRLAADRARTLVRQLLTFSRRQAMAPETLDLSQVVRDARRMLLRLLGEDVRLQVSLSSQAPLVLIDRARIEQVLVNLVVNARDAMPRGGDIAIEVAPLTVDQDDTTTGLAPGSYASLSVRDQGEGIPHSNLEHIFDPFFTTKEGGTGTGLGLATVHGIVHQSGGTIQVESSPGEGAAFQVILPASEQDATDLRQLPEASFAPRTETVLVVEDDTMLRAFTVRVLRARGHEVLQAANGHEASALLRHPPQLIHLLFTDVVLPGPSGIELAELADQAQPPVPVLFTSGYVDHHALHRRDQQTHLLHKPFDSHELLAAIDAVLDG